MREGIRAAEIEINLCTVFQLDVHLRSDNAAAQWTSFCFTGSTFDFTNS